MNLVQAHGEGAPALEDCPRAALLQAACMSKEKQKTRRQPGVVMLTKPLSEA